MTKQELLARWRGGDRAAGQALFTVRAGRARYAPSLVWGLIVLASYSAISAFRSGLLGTVGILIDVLLFIPLIWFAIWYQRSRRTDAAATRPRTRSQ